MVTYAEITLLLNGIWYHTFWHPWPVPHRHKQLSKIETRKLFIDTELECQSILLLICYIFNGPLSKRSLQTITSYAHKWEERIKTSLDALVLNTAGLFRIVTGKADNDNFSRESDKLAIRMMKDDGELHPNYQCLIRCRKSTPRHFPPIMTVQLPAFMDNLPE